MTSANWNGSAPFALHVAWEHGLVRLDLIGELDITGVDRVSSCVDDVLTMWTAPEAVRVDLTQLSFVDVTGLRALAKACERLERAAGSFELLGIHDGIRHAMLAAGIEVAALPPYVPPARH